MNFKIRTTCSNTLSISTLAFFKWDYQCSCYILKLLQLNPMKSTKLIISKEMQAISSANGFDTAMEGACRTRVMVSLFELIQMRKPWAIITDFRRRRNLLGSNVLNRLEYWQFLWARNWPQHWHDWQYKVASVRQPSWDRWV